MSERFTYKVPSVAMLRVRLEEILDAFEECTIVDAECLTRNLYNADFSALSQSPPVPAAEWVAVEERLPDQEGEGFVWAAYRDSGRVRLIARSVVCEYSESFSHWQPIVRPSPPGAPREET